MSVRNPRRQSSTPSDQLWQILIVRAANWQWLRPESGWRPTVTATIDSIPGYQYDLLLGTNGQNPNLRLPALLPPEAHESSIMVIGIHYQPSGKSRGKSRKPRRQLGEARLPLEEALKQQMGSVEGCCEVKLRLGDVQRKRRGAGHSQDTSVLLKVRAPVEYTGLDETSETGTLVDSRGDSLHRRASKENNTHDRTIGSISDESSLPSSNSSLRRRGRKKVKGYLTDDESYSVSSPSDLDEFVARSPTLVRLRSASPAPDGRSIPPPDTVEIAARFNVTSISNSLNNAYDTVTYHRELRETTDDTQLEDLVAKLVQEWQFVGGTLLAIVAIDATVFGFSSGTAFGVDGFARRALTISGITSALGLAIDIVLLFLYMGANAVRFQTSLHTFYHSHFYFALTSRLPLIATLVSLLALSLFLLAVTYAAWPSAVVVISAIAGVLLGLQYFVVVLKALEQALERVMRRMRTLTRMDVVAQEDAEAHSPPLGTELQTTRVSVPPSVGYAPPRPPRIPERERVVQGTSVSETREGV